MLQPSTHTQCPTCFKPLVKSAVIDAAEAVAQGQVPPVLVRLLSCAMALFSLWAGRWVYRQVFVHSLGSGPRLTALIAELDGVGMLNGNFLYEIGGLFGRYPGIQKGGGRGGRSGGAYRESRGRHPPSSQTAVYSWPRFSWSARSLWRSWFERARGGLNFTAPWGRPRWCRFLTLQDETTR